MDAHRKMMHRRQAFNGFPFDSTGGLIPPSTTSTTTTSDSVPTSDPFPPTVVIQSSSTTSSTSTSSTPSSTSSSTSYSSTSTSSSFSSSSSSSSSSSVTPPVPGLTTSTSSVGQSQKSPLSTTSFTQPKLTSLTSKPSSTGASGNVSGSSTNISTGAVIGGIAAGILGLAGIIFAILYFIRRMKKRKDDSDFDSDVFKRRSRMLLDEPQMVPDNDSPFSPRPPSMIERRMNSTPASNMGIGTYGPDPVYGGYNDYNAGYNHPGYAPGQAIPHHQPYGDSHMGSPMSASMSPPMSVNYGDVSAEQSQSAYLSRQPSTYGPASADTSGQYADLSRSSVTPFQAAQYEEIHRRLNMPPPEPVLGSLSEEEYPQKEPVPKGPSPFADSSEDVLPPPSPVHSNRSRIDSTPPKLPDFNSSSPMSPVYALHPGPAEVLGKQTEASASDLIAAPVPARVARPDLTTPNQKRDTVYTIYNDEDAYAGI